MRISIPGHSVTVSSYWKRYGFVMERVEILHTSLPCDLACLVYAAAKRQATSK